jgi:3D (Asp-Asp-Asp) domain-containing protein
MSRKYFFFFLFFTGVLDSTFAQSIVDCRVVASTAPACNPYGEKLLHAKEIVSVHDTLKLIRTKTLPVPPKPTLQVISVEDMIEKHLSVQDSLRYRGTKVSKDAIRAVETLDSQKALEKKIEKLEEDIVALEEKLQEVAPIPSKRVSGIYKVQEGDTLSAIAKRFALTAQDLAQLNELKGKAVIAAGQKLRLPVDQAKIDVMVAEKHSKQALLRKQNKLDMLQDFGKRTLRVTATAYTSHADQTSGSPFVAAWGTRLRPGMKIIAVSNDMLGKYGMRNGTKVRIAGLPGYYTVRDKMSNRFRKRIDIYMGLDRRAALRWGRRSVVIHW